jgi:hypothetical protein
MAGAAYNGSKHAVVALTGIPQHGGMRQRLRACALCPARWPRRSSIGARCRRRRRSGHDAAGRTMWARTIRWIAEQPAQLRQ